MPIFIVPGLFVCIVLAMPFLAKSPDRPRLQRAVYRRLVIAVVWLSYDSLAKDRDDPAIKRRSPWRGSRRMRVCELIRTKASRPPAH